MKENGMQQICNTSLYELQICRNIWWCNYVTLAHLPAVWIGSWQTLVFFLHCGAGMCCVGPAQTCTCHQLSRLPTGQKRSQRSGQTLDNPVTWQGQSKRVGYKQYEKNRKINRKWTIMTLGESSFGTAEHKNGQDAQCHQQGLSMTMSLTLLGSMPFTCRSWSRLHWDLLTKEEEPSNCFTFVIEISVGFLLVTEKRVKEMCV